MCGSGFLWRQAAASQGGYIATWPPHIQAMKKDQFARVVRIDKLTLVALEATLRTYRDHALAGRSIPTPGHAGARSETLEPQAHAPGGGALPALRENVSSAAPDNGEVGAEACPACPCLPGWWSSRRSPSRSPLGGGSWAWENPIVGRVSRNQYLLDVRTLTDADWAEIIRALDTILN